jgi:alpha-L-fucosidase
VQGVKALRTTAKNGTIFVHVFDWPASSLELSDISPKILSAHLLANGQPLKFRQTEAGLHMDIPPQAPDSNVSVIALRTL